MHHIRIHSAVDLETFVAEAVIVVVELSIHVAALDDGEVVNLRERRWGSRSAA